MGKPPCEHVNFAAKVDVARLTNTAGVVERFAAEVHVRCADCGVRFRWLGLEMGLSYSEPMTSVDGFELRAPIVPDAHLTSLMADVDGRA